MKNKKIYVGLSYCKNITNIEIFCYVISSSTNHLFLKSDYTYYMLLTKYLDVFRRVFTNCIFQHCYTTPGRALEGCPGGAQAPHHPLCTTTLTLCSNNVLHFSSRFYKTLKKRHVNDIQEPQVPPQAIGLLR